MGHAQNSKAGDAIAISGLEYQWKTSIVGARSAALLWCPAGAGAGPTIPIGQRRFMLRRFLATARFIGFFFAFALVFTAALAISMPSLFSLSRSNQLELKNTEQIQMTC